MVTEYWIRPGPNDQVPYASGADDGTSYANAWRGLDKAAVRTALATASNAVFWICGNHRAKRSGTSTYDIPILGGPAKNSPKIIRGDYAADPGVVWGGYIETGSWTNVSGDIWTGTTLVSTENYDAETGVGYAAYINGSTERILTRVASSAECDALVDSFYLTPATSVVRVRLGASENPTNNIMLAQYGHRFIFTRADARITFLHFHGLTMYPLARLAMNDLSGTSYSPRGLTFSGCKILYGSKKLMGFKRASEIRIENTELGYVADEAPIYLFTSDRDNFNNSLGLDQSRIQIHNSHRVDVLNCNLHHSGSFWRSQSTDSHLIGIQAADESTFIGNAGYYGRAAIVHWHSSSAYARMDDIEIAYNSIYDLHNGISATTSTVIAGIRTESIDAGDFSNRTVHHNWIGGLATLSVTPTYPPMAYRCQSALSLANAPECSYNVAVDMPVGIVMPNSLPYANYHDNTVVDPTGHSIVRYALGRADTYATNICDENNYSGLTDEATMFGNSGNNEFSAPSTAVTKTNWTNVAGSYRFDVNSSFSAGSALLRPDGGYLLRPDGGHILRP
jgi:hypothetical protein